MTSQGTPPPRQGLLRIFFFYLAYSLSSDNHSILLPPDPPPSTRMTQPQKTIAVVNATGRQAASLIRVASAVGYSVRAQIHSLKGTIAPELAELPNVTLLQGQLLGNVALMDELFKGAQLAFINTTSQSGDEVAIGRALADAAKQAGSIPALYL